MKSLYLESAALLVCGLVNINMAVPAYDRHITFVPYQTRTTLKHPPSYLSPCSRHDKKFNLCVKTTLQTFFNAVTHGSKELNLPPLDPLNVPQMKIVEGSGDVVLRLQLQNVSILGLSNTRIISVRSNLEDNKLEMTMKYPFLNIIGNFTGEGGVKSFPIVGDGPFSFNMTDVSAAWIIYLKESAVTGETHYKIDNFIIDIIPVDISARFGNSIDGDNVLGSALNGFFNENAQEIFKMTKPKITDALSGVFTGFANEVLNRFPPQTLLPP